MFPIIWFFTTVVNTELIFRKINEFLEAKAQKDFFSTKALIYNLLFESKARKQGLSKHKKKRITIFAA